MLLALDEPGSSTRGLGIYDLKLNHLAQDQLEFHMLLCATSQIVGLHGVLHHTLQIVRQSTPSTPKTGSE